MRNVDISSTLRLSSPHLFALLVTQDDDKYNVMAVSWFCFASMKPPKLVVCLSNKGYSGELIKKNGKYTLCIPTEAIKEKAMGAGKCSGRTVDKASELGFEWVWPEGFEIPVPVGSRLAWSLTLCDKMNAGDHTVYLADIAAAAQISEDDGLYAFNGYRELHTIQNWREVGDEV
jgi:flavin reductase (DIM6/NTAB) family NADH-FMN oxidoreductase RutF